MRILKLHLLAVYLLYMIDVFLPLIFGMRVRMECWYVCMCCWQVKA